MTSASKIILNAFLSLKEVGEKITCKCHVNTSKMQDKND